MLPKTRPLSVPQHHSTDLGKPYFNKFLEETVCIEVDRHDISVLLERKPQSGMDMLAVLGRQFHASQQLVRLRAVGTGLK